MRDSPRSLPVSSLAPILIGATMTIMIGAAGEIADSLARVRSLSPEQRSRLEANLHRFDQALAPQQQQAMREIDRRINELPADERLHYLAVLRRYHNWLNSLPETVRTTFLARPAGERIAQISSLSARYPLPAGGSPQWIWVADGGAAALVEIAAIFKVWSEMSPEQRRDAENPPAGKRRVEMLLRNPQGHRALREVIPAGFDEEEWTTKAEAALKDLLSLDPEVKDAMTRARAAVGKSKGDGDSPIEKLRRNRLRRLAINLYFQEHPPRPVDPANLIRFRAALPPWIQSAFDSSPPDEARRRLTIVYRLVHPRGEFAEPPKNARPKSSTAKVPGPGPARPPSPPDPRRDQASPKHARDPNAPF